MTRMSANFSPKLLRAEQKMFKIIQSNLEMLTNEENLLQKIITGDYSWVYGYDPETKHQSSV